MRKGGSEGRRVNMEEREGRDGGRGGREGG